MVATDAPIQWKTESAATAFTIQRGRAEQGVFCLSHTTRTDLAEINYQLDIPAGMDVAAVMAAAEAADPATKDYWRWVSTVPFQPSSSDFVAGLKTAHMVIEAARTRTAPVRADEALKAAGFVRTMEIGDDDTLWNCTVADGAYSLAVQSGRVALSFDPYGSNTRLPLLRLTLDHKGHPHKVYRFWPSFMQSLDALVAIALDAMRVREGESCA